MNQFIQKLWKMRGGVHPEFHKVASTDRPIRTLAIPPKLIIPLQQHVGEEALLTVKIGDRVLKGQALSRLGSSQQGAMIHAPSSGFISDIKAHGLPHPSGMSGMCLFIETDGLDATDTLPVQTDYLALSKLDILKRIESAGVVGLGGAAFPSAVKLAGAQQQSIDTLIINAAECEPYISCDDILIRERASDIVTGIKILTHLLQPKQCLIGIEDNKPQAIAALKTALLEEEDNHSVTLKVIPTQYPSGDARQLTRILTGIEIPKNQHAIESGVLCHNIATAQAVYETVVLNKPLLSRIVTITGDGVAEPCNVEALIGTPISYIIEKLGGYTAKAERMIMGGPMMGFALPSDELPIVKASNCILVSSKAALALANGASASSEKQVMPCIRCNKCAEVCPVNLLPQQLYWHSRAHDFEKATEHKLADCIECGACSYVCPSYIPLVDYFRFAKTEIKSQQQAAIKSSHSRERFEFNEHRKQRIKTEREAKRRQHKQALMQKKAEESAQMQTAPADGAEMTTAEAHDADAAKAAKQDAIKAAMARAKAKKVAIQQPVKKENDHDAV